MQTEDQVKCSNCGYDMRGLGSGILCPECGGETRNRVYGGDDSDGKVMQFINANVAVKGLSPLPDIRIRTKYWMRIAGLFVFTATLARFPGSLATDIISIIPS